MVTYILKVFPPSGSPTILIFPYQTGCQYSDGDPPKVGIICKGYEKITIFDQYRALSHNWCKIEPSLLWKANRKPHPDFRMVPVSMTVSDLDLTLTQISRSQYYSTSNNLKTVPDRAIFTMADQQKVVYDLSNGAIFNDLEQPLTQFSKSRYSLTLNIS